VKGFLVLILGLAIGAAATFAVGSSLDGRKIRFSCDAKHSIGKLGVVYDDTAVIILHIPHSLMFWQTGQYVLTMFDGLKFGTVRLSDNSLTAYLEHPSKNIYPGYEGSLSLVSYDGTLYYMDGDKNLHHKKVELKCRLTEALGDMT
jgi:hypothetical protein